MHIEWTRFLAYPVAVVMWAILGILLAPVSMAVRKWLPDGRLKRLLLIDPYRRVEPVERVGPEPDVRTDGQQEVVRRLPSPK